MTLAQVEFKGKGKPHIIFQGYKYREGYVLKNNNIVWRCLAKDCQAKVTTNPEKNLVLSHQHVHSGRHPVTIRSLTNKTKTPSSTPKSTSRKFSASTPVLQPSPPPSSPRVESPLALSSLSSQPITGSTEEVSMVLPASVLAETHQAEAISNVEEALRLENASLRREVSELREQLEAVINHTVESDSRLMKFTDQIFLTTNSVGTNTESPPQPSSSATCSPLCLKTTKAAAEMARLEEELRRLKQPCMQCGIFKEEVAHMISSMRSLEVENENLRKLCQSPSIPTRNSFEILTPYEKKNHANSQDHIRNEFTTVSGRRKEKKKKSPERFTATKRNEAKILRNKKPAHSRQRLLLSHRVSIIGDSHSRNLAALVGEQLQSSATVCGVCKPGAGLMEIARSLTTPAPADHCYVILAGTNDVDRGAPEVIFTNLEKILKECRTSSRVLVATLPRRHDLAPSNMKHKQISLINSYIKELCCRYEGVEVIDTDPIRRCHYTSHGMHLRQSGKQFLARLIVNRLYKSPCKPPYTANVTRKESAVVSPAVVTPEKNQNQRMNCRLTPGPATYAEVTSSQNHSVFLVNESLISGRG